MTTTGSPTIEVTVPCIAWQRDVPDAAVAAEHAARLTLATCKAPPHALVDITLTDDDALQALNRAWRGENAATNVLAFPACDLASPAPDGAPLLLGDVVLAFETVRREAVDQDKPLVNHLRHLVIHGVLHLLGYDHREPAAAAAMEAHEIAILAELGVPDPYRDTM